MSVQTQFFYVLIEGVTWKIASKLIKQTHKFKNTLNRCFNLWSRDGIFSDLHDLLLSSYKSKHLITELKIDSTDVMNLNCSKNNTYKSHKLGKQAIRVSIITDQNNVPINESIDKPYIHDSKLGIDLMISTNANNKKSIFIGADKGYIIDEKTKEALLKTKGFKLVTPKKEYKKKKTYKTKNYKSKVKKIRHSKQMKSVLKNRIYIEHFNSIYHRSYKRLSKVYDRKIENYMAFMHIAFSIIIFSKT